MLSNFSQVIRGCELLDNWCSFHGLRHRGDGDASPQSHPSLTTTPGKMTEKRLRPPNPLNRPSVAEPLAHAWALVAFCSAVCACVVLQCCIMNFWGVTVIGLHFR